MCKFILFVVSILTLEYNC